MNQLHRLSEYGQSYWLDNLTRDMIDSGELERRVSEEDLRGVTSNPSTFSSAIINSTDYDDQIAALVKDGRSIVEIYETLAIRDVRDACDILMPVYESTAGLDGYVSLEVSPYLAHDTEGTKEEARRLFAAVDRPNCLIKIPGTPEGIPAIEQMLYEGVNVNVTLLFSVQAYEQVARAYLRALDRREAEGKPVDNLTSVASFFLSRIDVLTDQLLSQRIVPEYKESMKVRPEPLLGRTAIASAKIAYQRFRDIFSGEEWEPLAKKGARVQRPLWASTSTKDPLYSDVRYVEPLIGEDTVNTMPESTITAFADHGTCEASTIVEDVEEAHTTLRQLEECGIDLELVTTQLVNEGVRKFIDPFDTLMDAIAQAREEYLQDSTSSQILGSGELKTDIDGLLDSLDEKQYPRRMFAKDGYLWTDEAEVVSSVENRLGWLGCPVEFAGRVDELTHFAGQIRDEGYEYVVLLGMGGSSLCPEVAMETFGAAEGFPELLVLDNTDPEAVRAVEEQIELSDTLFIVASKSGTTTETMSFYRYFYAKTVDRLDGSAGHNWIAITDPGTPLEEEATERGFRRVFVNPPDIGGRYSALSYFGLVPMALIGVDLQELLDRAYQPAQSSRPYVPSGRNPGIKLGAYLGRIYRDGVDKVTFYLSDSITHFGAWVEQLLAESTGKQGEGLVPIVGEAPGEPASYGNDRVFVLLTVEGDATGELVDHVSRLEEEGHPVIRITLRDILDLGAEFFRWELATATAGKLMGINPFDEPNVAESKENTRKLLAEWSETGELTAGEPVVTVNSLRIFTDPEADWYIQNQPESGSALFEAYFDSIVSGDYISLLAYFRQTDQREDLLQRIRHAVRDRYATAATLGYGPRYLHSTGQLHKGGPRKGLFLLLTSETRDQVNIPGNKYDFATLQHAQALGDYQALLSKERRVLRLHLQGEPEQGLDELFRIVNTIAK